MPLTWRLLHSNAASLLVDSYRVSLNFVRLVEWVYVLDLIIYCNPKPFFRPFINDQNLKLVTMV
jgi:hypothetical protein